MARVDRAARRAIVARLALGVLAASVSFAALAQSRAAAVELPHIEDLPGLSAQMRRERIPLLLFFSLPGCPYCNEVRRSYLKPRLKEGPGKLLIREVDITSRRRFAGSGGKSTTEAEFAEQFGVRRVPVVQLVDADLAPLGKPLVGIDTAGFYEAYLSAGIEEAQRAIRGSARLAP
jgi:thioredoxin-related protein